MAKPDSLVCLATFDALPDAYIVKGLLDDYGIVSIVDNGVFGSVLPIGFNSIGEMRLMVRESDAAEALAILESHDDLDHE